METIKQIFRVDRESISYLRSTIESYDGMAVVSTIDPNVAHIEIRISPGCEDQIQKLLESLAKEEGLSITKESKTIHCPDIST